MDVSTADFIVHALPASLTHEGSRAAILGAGRLEHGRKLMIKSIAVAAFALACATSAQAMSPVPLHQPDSLNTEVAYGCGPGRTRVRGVCVARTTIRQARRCVRWSGGTCVGWRYY